MYIIPPPAPHSVVAHDHNVFLRVENGIFSRELLAPLLKLRERQVDKACEPGGVETVKEHTLVRERRREGG